MAHPDDPPYLTVGTEVSAKYRGAFCEATIKIAERLVKCKVSYGKGQSAVVTNDCIKGPLKVGAQVEVKQTDGTTSPASLLKVTDNSTYTVVFDDGDERTLKRSSLCLKGGRHFHESESLDHLPLTDPENFGTPVNTNSKKPGRRRRHVSQSPPWENSSKKNYRGSSEFTVGKAVFLENDRRRSSWLPAVVVPTHYVLEPSEITPDTICLRSFKDGRYHVATENELHQFSPDKEPLLSMLEGDIQPMYMCKPAIERAMAYLDTGELPWDMDIFNQHPHSDSRVSEVSTSDEEEHHRKNEEESAEAKEFHSRLKKFHEMRGTPIVRPPMLGQHSVDLFQLYQRVVGIGGMDRVTQEMKWRSVHLQLGLPSTATSHNLRQTYRKFLHQFELYEKNKAKVAAKEGGKWASTADRGNKTASHSTVEERVHPQTPAHSGGKGTRAGDSGTRMNGLERGKRGLPSSDSPSMPTKRAKIASRPGRVRDVAGKLSGSSDAELAKLSKIKEEVISKLEEEEEEEEDKTSLSDSKSEASDSDPPSVGNSSSVDNGWASELMDRSSSASSNLERGVQRAGIGAGLEKCPDGYEENDHILVLYGKGKTQRLYEAKVVTMEVTDGKKDYLVHYSGWNNRYNEWIDINRIVGKIVGPMKTRPHFNKRKKSSKNGSNDDLFTLSLLPPGMPTSSTPHPSKTGSRSSRLTPPPTSSSSNVAHLSPSSLTPVLQVKKETITGKSLNYSNGKKSSKRNGSVANMQQSSMPATIYSSSTPVVSSLSPSTEVGSAMAGAGIRLPGRSRGGKLDRSRTRTPNSRTGGVVKEEPDSPPMTSPLQSQLRSSSNESSNDEEQPTPMVVKTEKGTTHSAHSQATKSQQTAKAPVPRTKSPSLKPSSTPTAKTITSSSKSLNKPSSPVTSKSQVPSSATAKPQSPSPAKPVVPETRAPNSKSLTPTTKPQSKQQTPTARQQNSSAKTVSVAAKPSPSASQSPATKPLSPSSKLTASSTKALVSSSSKSQASEARPSADSSSKLLASPVTLTASSPPHCSQSAAQTKSMLSSLICSETLPGLLPRQKQPLRRSPDSSTLNEAQSLLSLAMVTPPPLSSSKAPGLQSSHPLPSNHLSSPQSPPSAHLQCPSSLHTPLSSSSAQESGRKRKREMVDDDDNESENREEEGEERDDDDDYDEEMVSDEEEEEDETEEDVKKAVSQQKPSGDANEKNSKSFPETDLKCSEQRHSLPAAEKEGTPEVSQAVMKGSPSIKVSKQLSVSSTSSPDGKRKWRKYETPEEHEQRKRARHAKMNYLINFDNCPDMNSDERISLIQDRLREVWRRWSDLKAEVAYIEKKKKRAKRKGKVTSSQVLENSPVMPSNQQHQQQQQQQHSQLHTTIPCH